MGLLAVNRRDEGLVQHLVHVMRDVACRALGAIDFSVVFVTQNRIVVVQYQLLKNFGCLDNAVSMLIKHFKEIAFAGQQFAEKHL
jgi:hypothetical protein